MVWDYFLPTDVHEASNKYSKYFNENMTINELSAMKFKLYTGGGDEQLKEISEAAEKVEKVIYDRDFELAKQGWIE